MGDGRVRRIPARRRLVQLSLCVLAGASVLVCSAAGAAGSSQPPARLAGGATVRERSAGPPPVPTMARRRTARRANAERLIATPSTLPAAGGTVRLRARVRPGDRCRFSSAGGLRTLPKVRNCRSGRATVTVKVPRNTTSAPRRYVLYLTVRAAHGERATVRDVIVERPRRHSASGSRALGGVTAASGVNARGAGAGDVVSETAASMVGGESGLRNALEAPPAVTIQPSDQSVAPGAPVSFTAVASGSPAPSVQWQVSANGGSSWADTSPSFAASAAESGNEYRAVFTNAAGSATTDIATLTVVPVPSTNFSGYIAYAAAGQSFSAVSASWIVPTVTCAPGATTWAAQWPGIGDGTSVEQDGTETDCFSGVPTYWAWYEMYGDAAVNNGFAVPLPGSSYPVAPGDAMTGSVSFSGSTWLLTLGDATQNWTYQTQIASPTPGLSQGSAEWMVEDPDGCSPQCQPLAQFSPVAFTGASATANGQSGPISSFPVDTLAIDQNSTLLASPGPLDAAGDGFTDSWLAG